MQKDVETIIDRLINNMENVIYGKRKVIEQIVCALIARGHVLIEDVPGVGKTMMVNSLARSLSLTFGRIQCTPDVMPSDIVGFNLYNIHTGAMEFKTGMIMNQLVLADEINRAAPKTQSSLLEVMEEYQVSVDGIAHSVPQPFMVLATQNPVDFVGTSPLPEAQMDRFMMRVSIGYPELEDELCILDKHSKVQPIDTIQPVAGAEDIIALQNCLGDVYVAESVKKYIAAITRATRMHPEVLLGASPRATLALLKASQAYAIIRGRDYVTPDDVQYMCLPVLAHRLILKDVSRTRKKSVDSVINDTLLSVSVPALG